jgi:hypothetical protein
MGALIFLGGLFFVLLGIGVFLQKMGFMKEEKELLKRDRDKRK